MPQAVVDILASDPLFAKLPFSVDQRSSRASALIMLLLLVPALVTLLVPLGLLAVFAGPVAAIAASDPAAAIQVVLGLGLWTVLFVVPAKRLVQRFGRERRVHVDAGMVTVRETGVLGSRVWTAPLSEFRGLAYHVRATLSGLRHELILVHAVPGRSVLLHTADAISQSTIERAIRLLRLPQVPPGELYRFGARRPRPEAAPVSPMAKPAAA